ncbi:uncharacterized protein PAC_02294 [Phialocephala subalpina]|uniref:Uncharacterized protein n=1 Tax=Phialocephala subalpina TaxID=576137 RepID=A0A1L7WI49_9HELO|nr:uncharacterized protein PAC_02294 [Phialocephala subalpina]
MRLAPAIRAARKASQAALQARQAKKTETVQEKKAVGFTKKKESRSFLNDMPLIIPVPIGTMGYHSQSQPAAETQGANTQADSSQSWADGTSGLADTLGNTQSHAGWKPVPRESLPSGGKVWESGELVTRSGGGNGFGDGMGSGAGEGGGGEGVGDVAGDFLGGFLDGF